MTPKEMITVEKEVYDAVLRNSVRVNDLEAENAQLHKFLEEFNALEVAKENEQLKLIIKRTKACGNYPGRVSAYKARIINLSEENQQLKKLLLRCKKLFLDTKPGIIDILGILQNIDHAIGEK